MVAFVNLYSKNKGELNNFLSKFYNNNLKITDDNSWEKDFNNPVEIAELVGAYIDNNDNYNISMWICLDEGVLSVLLFCTTFWTKFTIFINFGKTF